MPEEIIIHDISTTKEVIPEPGLMWWQWGLIGLGILVIIVSVYFIIKHHKNKPVSSANALNLALDKLTGISCSSPQNFSVELSLLVRDYLHLKLEDPALFETNEEINTRALEKLNICLLYTSPSPRDA